MRVITVLFFLFVAMVVPAQKKEISEAKDLLKAKKNLDKVETGMLGLLSKEENKHNVKIYRILNEAVRVQYEGMNEKLYLKQTVDSAAMFNTLMRAYRYAEMTDSVFPEERKKNANFLTKYVSNLFAGGAFMFRKENYTEAWDLFDTYLRETTGLRVNVYNEPDTRKQTAAFRALCCGYRLSDFDKTVKYKDLALAFERGHELSLKYLAEIYQRNEGSYDEYIHTLEAGLQSYPCEEFFFTRLLKYHLSNQRMSEGLALTDNSLKQCPDRVLFRYVKASILLGMERFEDCIAAADSAIALTDSIADCFYIGGIANVYLAEGLKDKAVSNSGEKEKMLSYYKKALPYFQTYRMREPNRQDKWGSPLYNIYLNLNMGREFDEICDVLRQSKKVKKVEKAKKVRK
ncbi:MAG: hypothetical protein HUK08_00125 [Bacteroidaceae bacterium]|nr:hypothetical protein [Bacteroidaceae bacterium]